MDLKELKDKSINLVLAVTPRQAVDCSTEREYVEWLSDFLNGIEPKMADDAVVALSGYYGGDGVENKENAKWSAVLDAVETTPFAIGEMIVWRRGTEVESGRDDRLNSVCEPVYILCRKEEYRTYHLNVNEKTKKGSAVYHTPISNLCETTGTTLEEDYRQIEDRLVGLYNPKDGTVLRPFEERN